MITTTWTDVRHTSQRSQWSGVWATCSKYLIESHEDTACWIQMGHGSDGEPTRCRWTIAVMVSLCVTDELQRWWWACYANVCSWWSGAIEGGVHRFDEYAGTCLNPEVHNLPPAFAPYLAGTRTWWFAVLCTFKLKRSTTHSDRVRIHSVRWALCEAESVNACDDGACERSFPVSGRVVGGLSCKPAGDHLVGDRRMWSLILYRSDYQPATPKMFILVTLLTILQWLWLDSHWDILIVFSDTVIYIVFSDTVI